MDYQLLVIAFFFLIGLYAILFRKHIARSQKEYFAKNQTTWVKKFQRKKFDLELYSLVAGTIAIIIAIIHLIQVLTKLLHLKQIVQFYTT